MDLTTLISFFTGPNLLGILFKFINISFSVFYLLYAIVVDSQTRVMNKALETNNNQLIVMISFSQIFIGILLVILAVFVF